MKIVIPYKEAGTPDLKYCLRGIETYIKDPEITIIGTRPFWIKNINYVPFIDNPEPKFKARNIYSKIMTVADDFLFFNDDHFLLKPFSESTYHYSGTIKQRLDITPFTYSYRKTLQNTFDQFGDIKNFDTHCPIFYKPEILKKINVDWNKSGGFCIKSIYCHIAGIKGTEYPDLKIKDHLPEYHIKKLIENRSYFSTGNYAMNEEMIQVLEELYPYKSHFEN